jgi:hypothetical protein
MALPVGLYATVCSGGRIGPGDVYGEVTAIVQGSRQTYYAVDADGGELAPGTRVLIVDYLPPRSVRVTAEGVEESEWQH